MHTGAFKQYLNKPAAFLGFIAAFTALAYVICLEFAFPKFLNPLEPANRDVIDHYIIGSLSWETLLNAASRPTAWIAMKLVHPFGLYGLSLLVVISVLVAIVLIVLVIKERAELPLGAILVTVPAYLITLFCHPEFYVKHRDDIELDVAFLLFTVALYCWHLWTRTHQKRFFVIFTIAAILSPLAKETFFVAMPVLFFGLGLNEQRKFDRYAATIVTILATGAALIFLHSRNSFVHNSLTVYSQDFSPASVSSLLYRFLEIAFTPATLLLCTVGLIASARNRPRLLLVITFIVAGICSYLPNSLLPNHWIEWYGWDGLPILLAPILVAAPFSDKRQTVFATITLLLTACAIVQYTPRYAGFPSRLVAEEVIDQNILLSFPALKDKSTDAIFLIRGISDFQFLPWQTAGFTQIALGDGMRFELKVPADVIPPIRAAGGVPFENASIALADDAFIEAHPPTFIASYSPDGQLQSITDYVKQSSSKHQEKISQTTFEIKPGQNSSGTPPTLEWNAPTASAVEVHVNTPDGPLLTGAGSSSQAQTGTWVHPGMRFYLIDATLKNPKSAPIVMASLTIPSNTSPSAAIPLNSQTTPEQTKPPQLSQNNNNSKLVFTADPLSSLQNNGLGITTLHWKSDFPEIQIHAESPTGPLFVDQGGNGDAATGLWAHEGMNFYLETPADAQKSRWNVVATTTAHAPTK